MSYKKRTKGDDYEEQIAIKNTTITTEINNNENINDDNNYNIEQNIDDVIQAFNYFDMNHNGRINISELKQALSYFGNKMTEDEINNIFRSVGIDQNNNEDIDYINLINILNNNNN